MIKKQFCILIAGAVAAATYLAAAPLVKSEIAKDAKWLGHIDMEGVMSSSFAEELSEKIKEEIAKNNDSSVSIDVDLVLEEIKSLTAYGSSFDEDAENSSVLILKTGDRMQAIFDGFLAAHEMEEDGSPIERLGDEPYRTFLLENELYLAFPNKNYAIAGKSLEGIEKAYEVILGNADNLEAGDDELVSPVGQGFFLLASATGLDTLKDVPPQARMLQKATGGQLAFGELDGVLKANVTLTTPGPNVSNQLARIVEGLVALVSFAEVDNKNLNLLTQNTRVSQGDKFVGIDMTYPTEELMSLFEEIMTDRKTSTRSSGRSKEDSRYAEVVEDEIGGEVLAIRNVDASDDRNGHIAYHAVDGDFETDWVANGRRHWIRFMLESPSLVRELQVAVRKGDVWQARFAVQSSVDGHNWEDVIHRQSSGLSEGIESINIPDTATRWIRLRCYGNSTSTTNAISEIRWIGEANYSDPELKE